VKFFTRRVSALFGLVLLMTAATGGAAEEEVQIPYEKFVLDNGLTLIVHEDRKAPIVAFNIWYHVGSKNEQAGKTGFAHLFEHLMFNGSENYDDDWFKVLNRIGGTGVNGTTSFDRTNYFQNVPTTALDTVLWLESDRMGHLLGAIDQERLDEQRGVVQNEKRQSENQPYGRVWSRMFKDLFPDGHPYQWLPIGSMEDLEAASLEDVQNWFRTYYGPDNAVIVIAGDIDAATAYSKVQQYFGSIPAGPPLAKPQRWIPKRSGTQRAVMQDRVPQARLYKVWVMPEWGSDDAAYLDLASSVLGSGKNSRLYERLVYRDQIATDVSAFAYPLEIAGLFALSVTAQPGQDLDEIERIVDEELQKFLDKGPTKAELQRVKTSVRAGFIRGVERVGGFGGKSDVLAEGEVYGGSPDFYRKELARFEAASADQIRDAARRWLTDGQYILAVTPFPQFAAAGADVDRSALPEPASFPSVDFPEFERARLDNGMEVVVVSRGAIPVVGFTMLLDAGYAADQAGTMGTSSLAMSVLDEGTRKRSALEISEQLALLGASIGSGSNLDNSSVSLNALKENLDESMEIYADVILNPEFPAAEFERLRKLQLAAIQREKVTPMSMALRVLPGLLYGSDHAYSLPFSGSGTEASVMSLTRDDLVSYHDTWFKPNNATMVVVGDTTLAEVMPKLERYFGAWEPGPVPQKNIATVSQSNGGTVYLLDRPDSEQTVIIAGRLVAPKANDNEIGIQTANDIFGGDFTSRINLNLREDKHWTYGARSLLVDSKGQRPFLVYAPVQADKTIESMQEIAREFRDIRGDRPPSEVEIGEVTDETIRALPGRWETNGAVTGDLVQILRFGLPDDYWDGYPDALRNLQPEQVEQGVASIIDPNEMVWVVVGDRAKIEEAIRTSAIGELRYLDADGEPMP
jgi:zinc protease